MDEYLAWGESKGGRGGLPWGDVHARMRKAHLQWWKEQLGLTTLGELYGILPRVESILRDIQKEGLSGKTLQNYSEALCAFCNWAVDRGYLSEDPLTKLTSYDTRPQSYRRALSTEEILKLLQVAPDDRRLLYEVALNTGLRANEIRSLTVQDLKPELGALALRSRWTKNRKRGVQPIPQWLMDKLVKHSTGLSPSKPLLYVPSHTARELDKDMEAADIPKWTSEGKIDFHSFRTTFITRTVEVGANVKEVQTLARHSTPDLTMNVYAKTSHARLSELTERLFSDLGKCVQCVSSDDTIEIDGTEFTNGYRELSGVSDPENTRVRFPPPPPFRKDKPVSLGSFSGVTVFLFPLVSKGVAPVLHHSKAPLRTADSPHSPAFLSLFGP